MGKTELKLPGALSAEPAENGNALVEALERVGIADGWIAYGIARHDDGSLAPVGLSGDKGGNEFIAHASSYRHLWGTALRYEQTPLTHQNRFRDPSELMLGHNWLQDPGVWPLYGEFGVAGLSRMVVVEAGVCRAYVSALWSSNRMENERVKQRLAQMERVIRGFSAAAYASPELGHSRWLAGPDGRLLFASGPLRDSLADCVRAFVRTHDRSTAARLSHEHRGIRFYTTRMQHDAGVAYLIEPAPTHPARVHPLSRLTPRLQHVAELAALGLSASEIAQETQRSPNTIRTQLKAVYTELGVSNRAELTRFVGG